MAYHYSGKFVCFWIHLGCLTGTLAFVATASISCFFFFSFILAPILGIIACIFSLKVKTKGVLRRVFLVLLILALSVFLLAAGYVFVTYLLLYIYTPPALTLENLAVYNECIKFTKEHDEYKKLRLVWGLLFDGSEIIENKEETEKIKILCHRLRKIGCVKLQRNKDILLFYKAANDVLPLAPSQFLPVEPGVAYSLSGNDPNKVDSWVLDEARPFVKIAGNWYMSRHLMLTGPRLDLHDSIPESLFDRSLLIDGIDPNELHKFD